jgi:hypothetical protein
MKLEYPRSVSFWIAVVIAVISGIAYVVHVYNRQIPALGGIGFLLLSAAFGLLCLSLIIKKV